MFTLATTYLGVVNHYIFRLLLSTHMKTITELPRRNDMRVWLPLVLEDVNVSHMFSSLATCSTRFESATVSTR